MNEKKEPIKQNRDIYVDILRSIGILLVILAHINNVPDFLLTIRGFDVVLLVYVSGKVYHNTKYGKYILKRIKRLLLPTYGIILIRGC